MDVIDLCDDDVDMVASNSSNDKSSISLQNPATASTSNEDNDVDTNMKEASKPINPFLKVVAIEKLTKPTENIVTSPKKTSRRKSVLQPKAHDDDSIEFLGESSSTGSMLDAQNILSGTECDDASIKAIKAGKLLLNLDDVSNPNIELMHRVAFLRVSIQHTLQELGIGPIKFHKNSSMASLRAQYDQNKKMKNLRKKISK